MDEALFGSIEGTIKLELMLPLKNEVNPFGKMASEKIGIEFRLEQKNTKEQL